MTNEFHLQLRLKPPNKLQPDEYVINVSTFSGGKISSCYFRSR